MMLFGNSMSKTPGLQFPFGTAEELRIDPDRLPPITILRDSRDDARLTHALLEAHHPEAGLVVVHPTTGITAGGEFGRDVMAALGRPIRGLAETRVSGPESIWRAIAAWMIGDRVAHLVVLRAHRLTAAQRRRLLELRWLTGVHLILVWHGQYPQPRFDPDLAGTDYHLTTDIDTVLHELTATSTGHTPPSAPPDLPALPLADFPEFHSVVRRTLDPVSAARVEAVEREGAHAGLRALSCTADFGDNGPYSPLRSLLSRLVADSPGPNHTIALLRGAQAAFYHHDWHLDLPNLPFSVGPALTSIPFTPDIAARIRAGMANPVRAAALATALFSGLVNNELARLLRIDLAPDATTIHGLDTPALLAVPTLAQPVLRASMIYLTIHSVEGLILFTDGLGLHGQHLRRSADTCEIPMPARHSWPSTWIANATTHRLDTAHGQPCHTCEIENLAAPAV